MKILGTPEEIEWAKMALMNNCVNCPYLEPCNQKARREAETYGEVRHTCEDYLRENIEFVPTDNKI